MSAEELKDLFDCHMKEQEEELIEKELKITKDETIEALRLRLRWASEYRQTMTLALQRIKQMMEEVSCPTDLEEQAFLISKEALKP